VSVFWHRKVPVCRAAANKKGIVRKEKALESVCIAVQEQLTSGAEGGSRTHTWGEPRRILSPSTLPEASGMQRTLPESSDPKKPCIMRVYGT